MRRFDGSAYVAFDHISQIHMGIRDWFNEQKDTADGGRARGPSLMDTLLGRQERVPSLGEYNSKSYPAELRQQLAKREEVARELLAMDITNQKARVAAIPRLRDLLSKYPHPLVYETLIHAYIDTGRFDEAKGVVFAARQRRHECERSDHPEIRGEVESLQEWTPEDVEDARKSHDKKGK